MCVPKVLLAGVIQLNKIRYHTEPWNNEISHLRCWESGNASDTFFISLSKATQCPYMWKTGISGSYQYGKNSIYMLSRIVLSGQVANSIWCPLWDSLLFIVSYFLSLSFSSPFWNLSLILSFKLWNHFSLALLSYFSFLRALSLSP